MFAAPVGSIGRQPREDLLRDALDKAAANGKLVARRDAARGHLSRIPEGHASFGHASRIRGPAVSLDIQCTHTTRPRPVHPGGPSATPIYDALYSEYVKTFRSLPGDRSGEEELGFTAFGNSPHATGSFSGGSFGGGSIGEFVQRLQRGGVTAPAAVPVAAGGAHRAAAQHRDASRPGGAAACPRRGI